MPSQDLSLPNVQAITPSTQTRLDGLRRSIAGGDKESTARQFETLFGVMLVREMRRSMPKGLFGEGAGADVYEGWFDEHLGNALSRNDSLGLAGMVKSALGRAEAARKNMGETP